MPSLVVIGQQIKEKWRGAQCAPQAYIITKYPSLNKVNAATTQCDLSPRFFYIDATSLKAIRYESKSLNRIVADKLHRVVVA